MSEMISLYELELADSSFLFQRRTEILVPRIDRIFAKDDSNLKGPFPYFLPWRRSLEVNNRMFIILIIPQANGKFVARTSTSKFNATGQGRSEGEALQNIKSAIELLMEEDLNPSGDVPWPEDYR
jgi:predicted RNase H-like HicB family nuclease